MTQKGVCFRKLAGVGGWVGGGEMVTQGLGVCRKSFLDACRGRTAVGKSQNGVQLGEGGEDLVIGSGGGG